ncbi:amidohydrolase [Cupriavidus necator]|uniref:Amidohydrolase n=1 Tax=Cupriavidus necator TaxID=106590 RepID=A0A367PI05_CUPNE|nr:amidohydrolase [Cupriavidus necator]QQX82770.1 amidohydrolase [Cupriavidus necator]RCJ07490.1 amidohydrolase [Cupriavidus necator]
MASPSRRTATTLSLLAAILANAGSSFAQQPVNPITEQQLNQRVSQVESKVVAWRRDIHQHPELSGQEARTAKLVADHLRKLGIQVTTGVGGHGVVGLLKGDLPGKVVALRADMDALPVKEATGLSFASKVIAKNMGKDSPVMHACGHDAHTAMLMGVAEVLAGMKAQIPGTVKFIFQPAEEGFSEMPTSPNPLWGAKAMVAAGVMENPKVDAVFALHVSPFLPSGMIGWRSGPILASADTVRIAVNGKQTHGAAPWQGIDPIVTSAQIVNSLQTVVSRKLDITKEPAVLTIGSINGGTRENIVPDSVEMLGTLRTFDEEMRTDAKQRITAIAQSTATANGAKAEVSFGPSTYSVTNNDATLTETMLPTLKRAADGRILLRPKAAGAEDFSEYQKVAPGLFYFLGIKPKDKAVGPPHSPTFDLDESTFPLGMKSLAMLALDYLGTPATARVATAQ